VWNITSQNETRDNVVSRPRTRQEKGHVPEQGEGGGVKLQRKAEGEGQGKGRCNNGSEGQCNAWQRDEQVKYM
jgi:hypothetical protein